MARMLVRHRIREYSQWKPAFDSHTKARKEATLKLGLVLRSQDDPNDVFVLFDVGDIQKAQQFLDSAEFKTAMKEAGVVGKPETYLLKNQEPLGSQPPPAR